MNKQMMFTIGMTVFLLAGAQQALALVPPSINYSGELVETTAGTEQTMAEKNGLFYVRLYSSPTTNVALWARAYTVILNQGKFNIVISETAGSEINIGTNIPPLTSSFLNALHIQATDPSSEALYIGVRPLDDTAANEIMPRQRVVSVPFAMLANDAVAARRNFTVTNGTVTVKNLIVQKAAVFNDTVAMTAPRGASPSVTFASYPVFTGGMTVLNTITVSANATVTGMTAFNGLTVTSLTSGAASTLKSLTVKGTSRFNGALTAGQNVDATSTYAFGAFGVSGSISGLSGSSVAFDTLTAINTPFPPTASMIDRSNGQTTLPCTSSTNCWLATHDCFVVAALTYGDGYYLTSSTVTRKLTAQFYASNATNTLTGGSVLLAEVGMGVQTGYKNFTGSTSASFFLKQGEYLICTSKWGSSDYPLKYLTLIYRNLNYHND